MQTTVLTLAMVCLASSAAAQTPDVYPAIPIYVPVPYISPYYGVPAPGVSVAAAVGPVAVHVGVPFGYGMWPVSVAVAIAPGSGAGGVRIVLAQLDAEVFVDDDDDANFLLLSVAQYELLAKEQS